MAVEIGALRALLSLDSAAFDKGAKRAQASMNNLQRSLHRTSQNMGRIGRKLTTRLTLPLAGLAGVAVKSSLATVDAQSKMAQSLNTSTKSMQVLDRAADRAGISTGELEQIGRQLTKRLSQAVTGTGPAVKALDKLGLKASDLTSMDLDQKIAVINRAIAETVPEAEQAAVAMALFGDRAGIMAGRLDADTIATAADEIERFGIALTEIDADKIEEANDAISAIGLVTRGLANQIAVSLAPTLKTIAERIADVGAWFNKLSPEMKRFVGIAATVAAAIGPLAIALGFVAAGLAAMASPIGLVILAFGAVAGVAATVAANWDSLKERFPILETGLTKLGGVFSAVWEGIKGVVTGAAEAVNGAIETITGLFTGDLTRAIEGFKQSWAGLEEIGQASMSALLGAMEAIVPGFKQAVEDIVSAVSALPGRLYEWGAKAIQAFVDGIIQKWAELKAVVTSIFKMEDPGRAAIESGKNIGIGMGDGLISGIRQSRSQAKSEIQDYLGDLEQSAKDKAEIKSPSRVWMRIGRDLMDGLGIGIADRAQDAAASAAAAADQVTGAVEGGLTTTFDSLTHGLDGFRGAAKSAFTGLVTGANSVSDALQNVLRSFGNMLTSRVFDMLFPQSGGGILGGLFGGLGIPGFASGTNFAPGGLAWVGERGPELVNLPRGSQVIPNHRIGAGGNTTVIVNNNASGTETRETRRQGPSGEEVIIDVVNKAGAQGKLSGVQSRYGLKTQARRR